VIRNLPARGCTTPVRVLRVGAVVGLVAASACGGDNLFQSPVGFGATDRTEPRVEIIAPDSALRVAVGDSVLIQVRVRDDAGIAAVELSGFAIRGSVVLGTADRVERYVPKTIDFSSFQAAIRDTTISRYLTATADSVVEDEVFLVATVADVGGNISSDTASVRIGGPRIHILNPVTGSSVHAGTDLKVRISAGDPEHRFHNVWLRATEGVNSLTELRFEPPRLSLDTVIDLRIPENVTSGQVRLVAGVRNTVNDTTVSAAVVLNLLPPVQDTRAPIVRFSASVPTLAERTDSISVTVVGVDDTRIDQIGARIIPIHRRDGGTDTLKALTVAAATDSMTFRVGLDQFELPAATDTSTLRLEVTAFALDTASNCATATVPNTSQAETCTSRDPLTGARSGARYEITIVRGRTVRLVSAGDRIADLAADGANLFLSNITRNRLEVLPIGGTAFSTPVAVGSRPWGLSFNRERSLLYVANSGGTNISVVSPTQKTEVERIQTPNVKLYDVAFQAKKIEIPNPDTTAVPDSVDAYFPSNVTRFDYSDRPQYIGVTQNENLVFSTLPTAAARDGTIRVYRPGQARLEIVTDYAEERVVNKVVIVNADSAFLVAADPDNLISVCPRNRSTNVLLDRTLPVTCYAGPVNQVEETITALGYDTRFIYNLNIDEIGLADTTFVAVSGDHSTIAIGEGARENGRVISLTDPAGGVDEPFVRHGEVRDLVGNTAERLVGLALNYDGSLGLARGSEAFFFSTDLRLQGVVETDLGGGGATMHVDNLPRAFVSGTTPDGLAFIDVVDTFYFQRLGRIFLRDPVTGPIRAVRAPQGGLKIYAVTAGGVVAVDLLSNGL
jgi:hypothetical protein